MNLSDLICTNSYLSGFNLSDANRPIRLRLSYPGGVADNVLLVKQISGSESICGVMEYRLLCVAARAGVPTKDFIALPVEIQLVTDTGALRSICGIVARAEEGQSDGGLATYHLTVRDALSVMDQRVNTRVFRNASEVDITRTLLSEWLLTNHVLSSAFAYEIKRLKAYPAREFTMQYQESDTAFLRRLWARRGIAWFFQHGESSTRNSGATARHTLVLFDDPAMLDENAAGTLRYHRDAATEQRDSITAWKSVRTLTPGVVTRQSWEQAHAFMIEGKASRFNDQGEMGNQFAAKLDEHLIDRPHAGANWNDHDQLSVARMARHAYDAKYYQGESGVRDMRIGQWHEVCGHPTLDSRPLEQRRFVITGLRIEAENNLPEALNDKVRRLFAANGWEIDGGTEDSGARAALAQASDERDARYSNRFTCVRHGIAIVPGFDPRVDVPCAQPQSVIVVAPTGEPLFCDAQARVKVRFPGCREADHVHAHGAGASDTDRDSAWVRVASGWAGAYHGAISLPRPGDECIIHFMNGDPDRPVIIGRVHGGKTPPPNFSNSGNLPGNRFLCGIKSQEINGAGYNQLRLDDTAGQISAQLASAHGHSQLNLGYLTQPRRDGAAAARGEGAELRSDGPTAVRGGHGVLISSGAAPRAGTHQLERSELIGLAQTLQAIVEQLGALADTHHASGTDPAKFRQLVKHLQDWEQGSNTAAGPGQGGAPIVAISAVAGAGIVSQDNLVLGAQTHIDAASAGHTQISAGQQLRQRAATGISSFAHTGGIETIAAQGLVDTQAHQGSIHLTASDTIVLTAGTRIILQAPEVQIISPGAQTQWGAGSIVEQASGAFLVKSASFAHTRGGGGAPASVSLPNTDLRFDQQVTLRWLGTDEPMPNQRYRIRTETGQVIEGRTDAAGLTERFANSLAYGRYTIEPLDD